MTEKRIFDGVAVILEAVDFVATVEENEWSRGRGESKDLLTNRTIEYLVPVLRKDMFLDLALEIPRNNSTRGDPITGIASGTPVTILTAQ
jgi:hypothetical protein